MGNQQAHTRSDLLKAEAAVLLLSGLEQKQIKSYDL